MQHKWDEAFGYLYGNEADAEDAKLDTDKFLSKYLSRVKVILIFLALLMKFMLLLN